MSRAGNRRGQGKKQQPARATRADEQGAHAATEVDDASGDAAAADEADGLETSTEPADGGDASPAADATLPEVAFDELVTEDAPALEALVASASDAGAQPSEYDPEQRPISQIAPALHDSGLDHARTKQALESLIFVSDRIVTAVQLARALKVRAVIVRELLAELMRDYQGRGIELIEVAGGYQFRSAAVCAPFVRDFVAQKPVRLTRAQLETLALVSYRQPITRPEIDDVRGVDSGSAIRVLLERNLIKMLGRKDEPGRPLLYGTSAHFLEFFGMNSLKDLPTLREFTELSDENRALFKRKTGEDVEDTEAALAAAEEAARLDDDADAHISDEDLAALAAEAAREELGQQPEDGAGDDGEPLDDDAHSDTEPYESEPQSDAGEAARVDPE